MIDSRIIDRIEDIAVATLPVPGFEKIELKRKLFLYHLWHAAIAGDTITYAQQYRYGLQLRDLLLKIVAYEDLLKKNDALCYSKIENYAKKIFINHGNHDFRSSVKFVPLFTCRELQEAIAAINATTAIHAITGPDTNLPIIFDAELERIIFEADFERMVTQKNPVSGDIITESHNTFYQGVTLHDLENFKDQNPNNSTVIKKYGRVIEEIWRAGNRNASPGRYAPQLKRIVEHLNAALPYADAQQVKTLKLLIRYFEEGTASIYDDYNIAWLHSNPAADFILGFIEEYADARGMKGLYEGLIYYRDETANHAMTTLAGLAQELENAAPWKQEYKKTWANAPVANAIIQFVGTGGAGPYSWAGVNLPNAQWIREKHGSKNIIITNVTFASRRAFFVEVMDEFLETNEDRVLMTDHLVERELLSVGLHEIVGHGAGKSAEELDGDPRDRLKEHYSTLEEARAELCMLYHIWNPLLIEHGLMKDPAVAKSEYLSYALRDILALRKFTRENEIHEDHDRATHLIVTYLREKGAVEFYTRDGKTYPRIIDYARMREHIGILLAELQRIKSTGDYDAIRKLVETYAIHFDHVLRDEIVMRSNAINYPASIAYVMPVPKLVKDNAGIIVDVILSYPQGIIDQGVAWKKNGF